MAARDLNGTGHAKWKHGIVVGWRGKNANFDHIHTRRQYASFKLSRDKKAVFGEAIQEIRVIIEKEDYETGEGPEASYDILTKYKRMIASKIDIKKPMKVVMDCGNAAGAICAPEIFKNLNVDLTELYCDVDGTFPNHHPDPTIKENLADLIDLVKQGSYDIGLAFDGDADRVGVVDETGDIVWADQLIALFLPEVVQEGDQI